MSAQSPQLRKLYQVLKGEIGLNDEERLELACIILRRDITSYKDLTDEQVARLLDAAEGYEKIRYLLAIRF